MLSLPTTFLWSCFLTQVVPDVHFATQCPDLDDGLAKEIIGLPLQALLYSRLDVIILIPYTYFNAVRRVVALTGGELGRLAERQTQQPPLLLLPIPSQSSTNCT